MDDKAAHDTAPTREQRVDKITTAIKVIGGPEEWAENGGESSFRELNGNLIIKTTPMNHRAIRRLIEALMPGGMEGNLWPGNPSGFTAPSIVSDAP